MNVNQLSQIQKWWV